MRTLFNPLVAIVLAALPALAEPGHAQNSAATSATATPVAAVPTIQAIPLGDRIRLNGVLDEAEWERAEPARVFTQLNPEEGEPGTQRTEIRVMYDAHALYIGAMLYDTARVRTRLGRRDAPFSDSDYLMVWLDSDHDRLTAYQFRVNPSGVQGDALVNANGVADDSWDAVWDAAAAVSDSGWSVEIRIPFSQLRFSSDSVHVWGFQARRMISRRQEESEFAFTPKRERGGVARFGHLVGIRGVQASKRLEVLPYATASTRSRVVAAGNPFQNEFEAAWNAGVDLHFRVTPSLVLSATANPDFGQVEADPAVINLTAFETVYQERRPFFVAGAEVFQFGGAEPGCFGCIQPFYSRRIGAAPVGRTPQGARFADRPEATSILGAVKLTGRAPGGWTLGTLAALTGREDVRYLDAEGVVRASGVEPRTGYVAARARRDFRAGASGVGVLLTHAGRDLDAGLGPQFRSSANVGGLDFRHEWAQRSWSLSGYVAMSGIRGAAPAIVAAQEAPARYFQQPDADHLLLDSTRTSLQGTASRVEIAKKAGRHWMGQLAMFSITPGFETNDLGLLRLADRRGTAGTLSYVENRPGPVLRRWGVNAGTELQWNHGSELVDRVHSLSGFGAFTSYWGASFLMSYRPDRYDDRLTRGGVLARVPALYSGAWRLHTNSRQPYTATTTGTAWRDAAGAWRVSGGLRFGIKPMTTWSLSVGPNVTVGRSAIQYVASVRDTLATATLGRRYVFAELDEASVSFETRLNLVLASRLTLEVFAQPLIASGDYHALRELAAAGNGSFFEYGPEVITRNADGGYLVDVDGPGPAQAFTIPNRDFNLRSLRGNAVVRWEWRPGSTAFLVWQQQRSGTGAAGDWQWGRDLGELARTRPENVVMLKVSYWLNP